MQSGQSHPLTRLGLYLFNGQGVCKAQRRAKCRGLAQRLGHHQRRTIQRQARPLELQSLLLKRQTHA